MMKNAVLGAVLALGLGVMPLYGAQAKAIKLGNPGLVEIFAKDYAAHVRALDLKGFMNCLSTVRMLRAETLFFKGDYYEDVLMRLLQVTSAEQKRRKLSDQMVAPVTAIS